ncbi:MAG: bifunctional glutamate N-acetyltransferase/amino-acid acetyltransferase ArgJ [Acholeplasmatales bacterium]|nr:bifunctional glutamate N-acetyltransferase/amino-acid acetyltransferase ArgJ [Acholeplasmatales bacterium]
MIKEIENGVVAPKGFTANGIHAGIRDNKDKIDLALILSEKVGNAAAVYTTNKVKGAPIYVTISNINDGKAQAMICNSGNANTCNADGVEIATKTCKILAKYANIKANDVIVASTGVIGMPMSIKPFETGIPAILKGMGNKKENAELACKGIMTTDTVMKMVAVEFEINGKTCKIGAMTKGAGMIAPNMATMLCFITTDTNISAKCLNSALKEAVSDSFNMLSVDGDTSTNDTCSIIANGLAGNDLIDDTSSNEYKAFVEALKYVTINLAKRMAKDGEGASHLIVCHVTNAKTTKDAKIVAKSVINSSLLKAAIFGADANWGRVLCAIGYANADVDVFKVDMAFKSAKGVVETCKNGAGIPFSEEKAKEVLLEDEVTIEINLNDGKGEAAAFGCDLTYDYVKINGDYRS